MFENIVVATDGSDNAKRAAEVGAQLASACGARLTIVYVSPTYISLEDAENTQELPPEVKEEMKRVRDTIGGLEMSAFAPIPAPQSAIEYIGNGILGRANDIARQNGAKDIGRVLAFGDAAETIVAEAEKAKADLIVIGTRGIGDLGGLVMGSVSHKVIQLATCPCVSVK